MTHDDQDTESIGSSKNSLATAGIHEEPATAANRGHFINSTTIITIHHHHHPPSSPSPPSLSPPSLSPSTRSLPPQQIEVILSSLGDAFLIFKKNLIYLPISLVLLSDQMNFIKMAGIQSNINQNFWRHLVVKICIKSKSRHLRISWGGGLTQNMYNNE